MPSDRTPRISTITPPSAYTDFPVVLCLRATDLRPALRLSIGTSTLTADLHSIHMALLPEAPDVNGGQPVELDLVDWQPATMDAFWARTPPALQAGWYAFRVTNPRGIAATISHGFEALGPDTVPPTITVDPSVAPDSVLPVGRPVSLHFVVDDQDGVVARVEWTTKAIDSAGGMTIGTAGGMTIDSGTCPPLINNMPPPGASSQNGASSNGQLNSALLRQAWPHRVNCEAVINIPPASDLGPAVRAFTFHIEARDAAGHPAALDLPLRAAPLPIIVSFAGTVGGLDGNQPFVVRGRDFLPGSQALLDDEPLGGPVVGGELRAADPGDELATQMIVGLTPPHVSTGEVTVKVRSEAGTVMSDFKFFYSAPPHLLEVQPTMGATAGGTRITVKGNDSLLASTAYIGATPQTRLPLFNLQHSAVNVLTGCLPPGTGTMSIWVSDPVTGEGMLPDAFTYQDSAATLAVPSDPSCQ